MSHDPYNYADLDVYTFNVNFDLTKGRFDVDAPVKIESEASPAAHPHLEGIENGELFVVCTPDGIYGPYATRNAASSLIEDEVVDPTVSEVVQLTYPDHD